MKKVYHQFDIACGILNILVQSKGDTAAFMTHDPRFALGQELETKQILLDQLRALATDDPDFFVELIGALDASIPSCRRAESVIMLKCLRQFHH